MVATAWPVRKLMTGLPRRLSLSFSMSILYHQSRERPERLGRSNIYNHKMLLLASVAVRDYTAVMKRFVWLLTVLVVVTSALTPVTVYAQGTPEPELYIRQIKITGEEFVVLQANAESVNLGDFWVGYNSNELSSAVVPTQQLPARTLLKGQAIVLTSDGTATCDAVWITKLSFSLGDTRGVMVLRKLVNNGSVSTFTTIDTVNWAKPAVSGLTTANLDLRKETTGLAYPVWYQDKTHTPAWRVGNMDGCVLTMVGSAAQPTETVTWTAEAEEPPAIIENLADQDMPAGEETDVVRANVNLAPPQITELLPNPIGTGTDATEEYIELYNSNDQPFNLAKFALQTGVTTKHTYTFPTGTILPAKGFRAFYANETGLSMSNTGSQAALP